MPALSSRLGISRAAATMVEYALLLGLISIVSIAAIAAVGVEVRCIFERTAAAISNVTGSGYQASGDCGGGAVNPLPTPPVDNTPDVVLIDFPIEDYFVGESQTVPVIVTGVDNGAILTAELTDGTQPCSLILNDNIIGDGPVDYAFGTDILEVGCGPFGNSDTGPVTVTVDVNGLTGTDSFRVTPPPVPLPVGVELEFPDNAPIEGDIVTSNPVQLVGFHAATPVDVLLLDITGECALLIDGVASGFGPVTIIPQDDVVTVECGPLTGIGLRTVSIDVEGIGGSDELDVQAAVTPLPQDCTDPAGGADIPHGGVVTYFTASSVACPTTSCSGVSVSRTCTDGTLSGNPAATFASCSAPATCTGSTGVNCNPNVVAQENVGSSFGTLESCSSCSIGSQCVESIQTLDQQFMLVTVCTCAP